MKAETLLKKTTVYVGSAVLAVAMSACSTHRAVDTSAQTTGQVRTEASAQQSAQANPDQILGTSGAPANTQGAVVTTAPAVISGPAAVDKSGNLYTSSSVGSAGNASSEGLNTNVNIKRQTTTSTAEVTQTPIETPAPVVTETPAPAPAPTVVETTPAPAPMISAQTEPTTPPPAKHHRRMRKD